MLKNFYVIICIALISFGAMADEKSSRKIGAYAFLGVTNLEVEVGSDSESEVGFSGTFGARFNRYFGIETSYYTANFKSSNSIVTGEQDISGLSITPVGYFNITNELYAFGKIGIMRAKVDVEHCISSYDCDTWSDSENDLTYGLGLQYQSLNGFSSRLSYDMYNGDYIDGNLLTFAIGYHF